MTTKETTKAQTQTRDQSKNHTKQEINHEPSSEPNQRTHEIANPGGKPKQQNPRTQACTHELNPRPKLRNPLPWWRNPQTCVIP